MISSSGKIAVSTPNGAALSADDFFVPPSPYSASDVAVTGRMTSGGSQTVNFSTASKIGMILFEAGAGQRAAVKVTSSSIPSTNVSILNPNGSVAGSGTIGTNGGIVDTPTLVTSGTYTIVVDPNASYTGSLTFTLYVFNDLIGSITAGGSAVTVTTTIPGQNGQLSFSGSANQRVSLKVSGVNLTGGTLNVANVSIKKPDGSTLV
ncbi:MAG: IPT/TIG domain-containing protein, partial [Pyrinomonadaceae bacterium]